MSIQLTLNVWVHSNDVILSSLRSRRSNNLLRGFEFFISFTFDAKRTESTVFSVKLIRCPKHWHILTAFRVIACVPETYSLRPKPCVDKSVQSPQLCEINYFYWNWIVPRVAVLWRRRQIDNNGTRRVSLRRGVHTAWDRTAWRVHHRFAHEGPPTRHCDTYCRGACQSYSRHRIETAARRFLGHWRYTISSPSNNYETFFRRQQTTTQRPKSTESVITQSCLHCRCCHNESFSGSGSGIKIIRRGFIATTIISAYQKPKRFRSRFFPDKFSCKS